MSRSQASRTDCAPRSARRRSRSGPNQSDRDAISSPPTAASGGDPYAERSAAASGASMERHERPGHPIFGMRATIRMEVVSSSICNHGRICATA